MPNRRSKCTSLYWNSCSTVFLSFLHAFTAFYARFYSFFLNQMAFMKYLSWMVVCMRSRSVYKHPSTRKAWVGATYYNYSSRFAFILYFNLVEHFTFLGKCFSFKEIIRCDYFLKINIRTYRIFQGIFWNELSCPACQNNSLWADIGNCLTLIDDKKGRWRFWICLQMKICSNNFCYHAASW